MLIKLRKDLSRSIIAGTNGETRYNDVPNGLYSVSNKITDEHIGDDSCYEVTKTRNFIVS